MTDFESNVIDAVTGHMNGDHPEDNLLIARAFGAADAATSKMVGLDAEAGVWLVTDASGERELRVEWPGGKISERPEIRREVVALYKAACEKLGVPAREEHGAPAAAAGHGHGEHGDGNHGHAHGEHPHGEGAHGAQGAHGAHGGGHPHAAPDDDGTFSSAIRAATWGDHGDRERATVMEDTMQMRASIEDYTELVAQHYFMYQALEEASKQLAADPRYAALHPAALVREQNIADDLQLLLGDDWLGKIEAVEATASSADRIREIAAEGWIPGIVAHHYTRYLGDLSGGQMIAKRMKKQHGFDRTGIAFYDFTELGSIAEFKKIYREALDLLGEGLDEAERQRMIDEVRLAYRFNTQVFIDMQKSREALAV